MSQHRLWVTTKLRDNSRHYWSPFFPPAITGAKEEHLFIALNKLCLLKKAQKESQDVATKLFSANKFFEREKCNFKVIAIRDELFTI